MSEIFLEVLKPVLFLLFEQINNHKYWPAFFIFILFFLAVTGFIELSSCALRRLKLIHEIKKIKFSAIETEFNLLSKMHLQENNYRKHAETYQLQLLECLLLSKNKDYENLNHLFENIKYTVFNNLLPEYSNYLDFYESLYGWDISRIKALILDDLIPILDSIDLMTSTINSEFSLANVRKTPLKLEKSTLRPFERFVQRNTSILNRIVRNKFNKSIDKLKKHC